jgi:hypothetical protein
MSYTLTLQCGCTVHVACHPGTRIAHTRMVERRGEACRHRLHGVGRRLALWELLPERLSDVLDGDLEPVAHARPRSSE